MRHIQGENRFQTTLLPESLEDFVDVNHPVRVIDAYIDSLDIRGLEFSKALPKETGRKPYDPADLLKLYVYGYLNKVRTSRRLETECHRNLEVLWLMRRLAPNFKTIADFRKDNGEAIRRTCRAFVHFCRKASLLSGDLVAIDGSKFKAAASKDRALTRKQVQRDRAETERKIDRYLKQLDEADQEEGDVELERTRVSEVLEQLKKKTQRLDDFEHAMEAGNRNQHCETEPDARFLRSGRDGTILGYNVQTAVDADTGLIVHHAVTNDSSDSRQLQPMAEKTKEALGKGTLDVLADAGYSNGAQLAACEQQGITATVPRPAIPSIYKNIYQKSDFTYEREHNQFRCPAGNVLHYARDDNRRLSHVYKRKGCDQCSLQDNCTKANTRTITRHFNEDAFDRSAARLIANPSLMNQRMAIAERPFAILKRAMAMRRFTCRGIGAASTEMAIGVLSYNLNRMINAVGVPRMLALIG